MKRRLLTIWLLAFGLLGNLMAPTVALACIPPVSAESTTACPMSGKVQARCGCCAPGEAPAVEAGKDQLSAPLSGCECQIAPGPYPDTDTSVAPAAPKTQATVLPVVLRYSAPALVALQSAPPCEQPRSPQSLPRPPDSGRAPPVA